MTSEIDTDLYYYMGSERDSKADSLRQRQLQDQQALLRLRNRTDYVVQPGIIGSQGQSLKRIPMGDVQRVSVGEQIVHNPLLLKQVITQTPAPSDPRSMPINTTQKNQKSPIKNTSSVLNSLGLPTGMPAKKWPTSFKKAFHKPTTDERVMSGLNNLDRMSQIVLGNRRRI